VQWVSSVACNPMGTLQAVYYRASDGSEPVDAFLDGLAVAAQASLDLQIDRINMLTPSHPHLPFPHSSQIEGELRELRCHHGRDLYRILYRRSGNLVILLHVFSKTGRAVPESDKQIARDRRKDFKQRMDAEKRQPPRAAGHDAP
jgi:phage-related protein